MKSNKANVKVMTPKADARMAPDSAISPATPIAPLVKQMLEHLGEDTGRDGLRARPSAWSRRCAS